jgi:gliding motility-associated-like protein
MYKRIVFFIFLSVFVIKLSAQKQTWHWYFGSHAGLDFSSGNPVAVTNGSILYAYEGCASISDTAGNYLFYANGSEIWNKSFNNMQNGSSIQGNHNSAQSAIIVPQPGNDSLYYTFTLDAVESYANMINPHKGFKYNIVNMKKNGGLGAVILKNIAITDSTCEKLTAVRHCNGRSMWIIVSKANSNKYYAYLLDQYGLSASPVISQLGAVSNIVNTGCGNACSGYMKASPNGRKIAVAHSCNGCGVELFDFNNSTGELSNAIVINSPLANDVLAYGLEFSPNMRFLYVSYTASDPCFNSLIFQYDISSNNATQISSSAIELYSNNNGGVLTNRSAALQIASDNKIYVSLYSHNYISVINQPNLAGTACNFVKDGVFLNGNTCEGGLPTFFQGYFFPNKDLTFTQNCLNFHFTPICDTISLDSIRWNFGDIYSGISNSSNLLYPHHKFSDTGNYTVKLFIYYPCRIDTVLKNIHVAFPNYTFPQGVITDTATAICLRLKFTPICDAASLDSLRWNFGDVLSPNNTSNTLTTYHTFSDTGTYQVKLILYANCKTDTLIKTINMQLPINGIELGNDTTLCDGNTLLLQPINIVPLTAQFLWQDGSTLSSYNINQQGKYKVKLTIDGCSFSDSLQVDYLSPPVFNLPSDTIICENERIYIDIPQGNYNILWNDNSTANQRVFDVSGTYSVTIENQCGIVNDLFTLEYKNCNCYIYFPNAFTPVGDGTNETFGAVYNCEFDYYNLQIFNRWGQLIFSTTNPDEHWNGKFLNENVETGCYVWFMQFSSIYTKAMQNKKGIVTIIR